MGQKTITISTFYTVADEATKQGLLKPEALVALLQEEFRLSRVGRLFGEADKLGALDLQPLTKSELDVRIQAVRKTS